MSKHPTDDKLTTIQIHESTKTLLREIGKKDESYEDVIKRLIEGIGEVFVDILSVDGDTARNHSAILRLGDYYYLYDKGVFKPIQPKVTI